MDPILPEPSLPIRTLQSLARILGLKRGAAPSEDDILRQLETHAARVSCHVQRVMDIHPDSRWFPVKFQREFGGFHPPGQTRTLLSAHPHDRVRSDLLTLLLREIVTRAVPGAIAELGVHRGATARLLHHYCPERTLYLFDTFAGFAPQDFPKETLKVGYNETQQFTDTNIEVVLQTIEPRNAHVIPVVGWFPGSVTPAVAESQFAFVHLDADLEAPTAAGLDFFWPRLNSGGFIVVHDYNTWPGARLAVDRFRATHVVVAVPMPDKSGSIVLGKP